MPHNVAIAQPVGVLPFSLCLSFQNSKEWAVLHNQYHDATQHYGQLAVQVSRNTFKLAKRLRSIPTPQEQTNGTLPPLQLLRKFYDDHDGPMIPFVFYDVYDVPDGTPIGANYDDTGNETEGQYIVRFGGSGWGETGGMLRADVPDIQLVEVGL